MFLKENLYLESSNRKYVDDISHSGHRKEIKPEELPGKNAFIQV